jgi:phosphate transport system substrate-binding protein
VLDPGRSKPTEASRPRPSATRVLGGLLFGWMALSLLVTGCSGAPQPGGTGGETGGTLTISGAWALYPMVLRWGEEFGKLHPGVTFDISAGGAGKGMADALSGAVDIGMVSRAIYPEEIDQGAFWVTVTEDAVVPTVNDANPFLDSLRATGLTADDFRSIWTGEIPTWGELVGDPSITDAIHVYTRSDACGAGETWAAFLGGLRQEDLGGVAVYGDPGLAEAVAQDPLGIGYNNLNFAFDADTGAPVTGLAIVPIDLNGDGQISEAESFYMTKSGVMAAIADGRYPSPPARGLSLVTHGRPDGITLAFIRWVLTDGQAFTEETGYIPLTDAQAQSELSKLE